MNLSQKVILVPFERVMGLVSNGLECGVLRGMKRTSVFDFLFSVPVCILSPNFFRCSSTRFAVLVASSLDVRINALSSTYNDNQWIKIVPFD